MEWACGCALPTHSLTRSQHTTQKKKITTIRGGALPEKKNKTWPPAEYSSLPANMPPLTPSNGRAPQLASPYLHLPLAAPHCCFRLAGWLRLLGKCEENGGDKVGVRENTHTYTYTADGEPALFYIRFRTHIYIDNKTPLTLRVLQKGCVSGEVW